MSVYPDALHQGDLSKLQQQTNGPPLLPLLAAAALSAFGKKFPVAQRRHFWSCLSTGKHRHHRLYFMLIFRRDITHLGRAGESYFWR
jgi:hypothetical protein